MQRVSWVSTVLTSAACVLSAERERALTCGRVWKKSPFWKLVLVLVLELVKYCLVPFMLLLVLVLVLEFVLVVAVLFFVGWC